MVEFWPTNLPELLRLLKRFLLFVIRFPLADFGLFMCFKCGFCITSYYIASERSFYGDLCWLKHR